jgi:hypothetical protein
MSVVNKAVKIILAQFEHAYQAGDGEFIPERFTERRTVDDFLDPQPDVLMEHVNEAEQIRLESEMLLGLYQPMQSPGTLILNSQNLRRFFWALMHELQSKGYSPTEKDLEAAAWFIAYKTYHHEKFHYASNVMRVLFGSCFDSFKEEALAVAFSYRLLADEKWYPRQMNPSICNFLLDRAFQYRSPGYRDWHLYKVDASLKDGLQEYFFPPSVGFLRKNGVPTGDLIFSMLKVGPGTALVEKII